MYSHVKIYSSQEIKPFIHIRSLQISLLRLSFFNLLLVTLIGLLMRIFPFIQSFPLEYKNILHGHSHFAFGGWIMPALLALFLKSFPELVEKVSYQHWRNIAVLMLASAYGMLLSFPVEGYKAISISFSTLSIASGYYFAVVVWAAMKEITLTTSHRFVQWAFIYFAISAFGPFATGPLIAMGKQGSPLYFDAIYFYLHFQYNGFFIFLILAFFYKKLEQRGVAIDGEKAFRFFNLSCIPSFALSLLWNSPSFIFNIIGGVAAMLQLIGLWYLVKNIKFIDFKKDIACYIMLVSLIAFVIKILLQFFSALPVVAALAYQHRNFVIAYLHLVLLGFISAFIFAEVVGTIKPVKAIRQGLLLFFVSFVGTELLLVLNAFSLNIPYYAQLIALFTIFFPVGVLWINLGLAKSFKNKTRVF